MKKYLFLVLHPAIFFCPLLAEEEADDSAIFYFELGEISVPLSFYMKDWDPKQKLLPILPDGKRVEEKDLIVNLDKSIKEAREQQDLLRSQRSWLSDPMAGMIRIEIGEEFYETNKSEE
jgi:hypothetical protein